MNCTDRLELETGASGEGMSFGEILLGFVNSQNVAI